MPPLHVAALTPLRVPWPHAPITLADSLRIVETPRFDEKNWGFWNLRRTEEGVLERTHWLRADAECEWHDRDRVLSEMTGLLRSSMLGFQLWAPVGWDGIIFGTRAAGSDVLTVENVSFAAPYFVSHWARMLDIGKFSPDTLPVLIEGTVQGLTSHSVRSINPFQFLELGLQTAVNHERAGALLWTLGLDALLAAERQDRFAARLKRLLGPETLLFPEDFAGRRPVYTVADVASGIYDLRNLIAHGKEVVAEYRERIKFGFAPPSLAHLAVEGWTYELLLRESALLALIAALRKVLADGLLAAVAEKKTWERWLDSSASTNQSRHHASHGE